MVAIDEGRFDSIFESIGFSKNEIKVYLDLVKQESSTALEISKRTGIHRSNTYDIIRSLISKGFIREMSIESKRVFRALHPDRLKGYLDQKRQEVENVLPELTKYARQHGTTASASWISEGIFVAREILMDLLKLKSSIIMFGASLSHVDYLGRSFLEDFHKERIKNQILMKRIFSKEGVAPPSYLCWHRRHDRFYPSSPESEDISTRGSGAIWHLFNPGPGPGFGIFKVGCCRYWHHRGL